MVADDNALDLQDNVNTRDQNRVGIWLIVVVVIFIAFLAALGMGHAPQTTTAAGAPQSEAVNGNLPAAEQTTEFSINSPVGELELPGTVGEQQHYILNGHGNTPAPAEAPAQAPGATKSGAVPGAASGSGNPG